VTDEIPFSKTCLRTQEPFGWPRHIPGDRKLPIPEQNRQASAAIVLWCGVLGLGFVGLAWTIAVIR
jgi:hypothetical protein